MVLRVCLGLVYLAMAAGQLVSGADFPRILSEYRVVDGVGAWLLAGLLVVGELVAAVGFLARPRSLSLVPVVAYTAVSAVWAGLAVQAFARGLVLDSCGCFGRYLNQPLWWGVLVQDALLLLYAVLLVRRSRAGSRGGARGGSGVAGARPARV